MSNDIKIIVLGNSNVGKTSFISKLVDKEYKNTSPTVSVDVVELEYKILNTDYKIKLWDTIGQEKFKSFQKMVFQGSMAAVLIYDITNPKSFEEIKQYLLYLDELCKGELPKIVLGNKSDLINNKEISFKDAKEFSEKNGCLFKEISVYNTPKNTLLKIIQNLILEIDDKKLSVKQKKNILEFNNEEEFTQTFESKVFEDLSKKRENKKSDCC